MDPLIISCAVSGGFGTPDQNPHMPFNPEAIGRSAVEAWREGAAVVHIHARDDSGEQTWKSEFIRRTIDVIRTADCDVILNLTTSSGSYNEDDWDKRFAALEFETEIASFDCGTMNFGEGVFFNRLAFLRELAARMRTGKIKPELEIFDAGMIATALQLYNDGLLDDPLYFQFVLGVKGGAPANPRDLLHLVNSLPAGTLWSACAVGRDQLPIDSLAIAIGGHARTGLEDNMYFRKGKVASNAQLVERLRLLSELQERPVATPLQARGILGLTGNHG
jgi:3-keto-5-aminohexanoate cleavage enzyme